MIGLQSDRDVLLREKLLHITNSVSAEVENARGENGVGFLPHVRLLKFFCGSERQTAFAVEEFFQTPVTGTRFAPDDAGRNELAQFATVAPPFQPVFVADRAFNWYRRDI